MLWEILHGRYLSKIPERIFSLTRCALARFSVKTPAPKPNSESFAISIASSSVSKETALITGAKSSVLAIDKLVNRLMGTNLLKLLFLMTTITISKGAVNGIIAGNFGAKSCVAGSRVFIQKNIIPKSSK